jgi:phospholipase/carboxylesterase
VSCKKENHSKARRKVDMASNSSSFNPHQGQPVLLTGQPLARARGAMVLLHGRGATAEGILGLAEELNQPDFAYVAPQAAGSSWYPYSFLVPQERNEPYLTSALKLIEEVLEKIAEAGIPAEHTILAGFSQGACLALEFAARHTRRYGGVAGLSGGLIGSDDAPRNYQGSLASTPIFLGCSDVDGHIPAERVRLSSTVLQGLGGEVTMRLYPGMGHTINPDEIDAVRTMMAGVAKG